MLSVEQGVIDATTEEGQRTFEEIERSRKLPGDEVKEGATDPDTGDPA
jgi:cell division cycle protein 37